MKIRDSAEVFCSSAKDDAELSSAMSNISANTFSHRTRTSCDAPPQAPFRRVQRRSPPTTRHLVGGLLASCEARATSSSRPTGEECPQRAEARVLATTALQ